MSASSSVFKLLKVGAVVVVAALVSGCNGAPVVRSDTDKNFRKSVEEIARRAPKEKMEAFDLALRAMVLSRAISGDAERHSHFVSFTDSAAGSRAFTSPLQDWSSRRSSIVVTRIGRFIDGKSIDDIIELAVRERQALAARMREWGIRQSHGPDMTWTQPDTPPLRFSSGDDAVLERVQISGVSLARVRSGDGHRTILSFLIENLSDQPVRSITLANHAEAQTREIEPEAAFHYVMPTPLAPGARRRIMTAAELPASLSREISLIGMEDGAGRRTGASGAPRAAAAPPMPLHYVAVTETSLMNLRTLAR